MGNQFLEFLVKPKLKKKMEIEKWIFLFNAAVHCHTAVVLVLPCEATFAIVFFFPSVFRCCATVSLKNWVFQGRKKSWFYFCSKSLCSNLDICFSGFLQSVEVSWVLSHFFAGLSRKQSATMSAASSQKVVLKSTTKVSLNERWGATHLVS